MFSVFKNINRFAGKSKILDIFAIFCARILPYLLVFFLIVFAFVESRWQLLLIPVVSGLVSRFVITQAIYFFYRRQRPAFLENSKILIPVPKNPSLPSGHASFFFGISFMLLFYSVPLGITFLALSLLIGITRVFCGVHWFSDILAGVLTGIISSLIIFLFI